MLQYLKRQAMKLRSGLTKGIVLLLCLATLFSSAQLGGLALIAEAADGDTVTVTVNYVYKSNSAMVAQPYTAQIAKGAAFQKTIEVPYLFNYSIPNDQAVGLGSGIKLEKNTVTNKYSLGFDLSAVNEDITVNLYYVAGQAQYTVKHYYQNLENDEYTFGREVELTGDIDAYTNAVADSKPGFVCLGVPQTTVAADGTTVVEIYYDREYYTVTFDVSGGINGPEPIYAKYGTKFNVSDIRKPTRAGYKFMGWKDVSNADAEALSGEVEITENVTYTAQWVAEKGQADYSIVLWGQNANDNEYSYLGSYEAWGNVGNQVTWNEDTLISHVHTDDCWELTCSKEAHTHTNNVIIMPQTDKIFTAHYDYGSKNTMTYYVEDLNGNDIEIFKIEFNGYDYTVTADEYYELEGFTIDKARSTNIGDGCDGAKFYYTRNSYKLEFYSASRNDPEKTNSVKYQDSLSQYNYTPIAKPDTVEPNAVFVGWYLNPECTGEPFDLSAHVMPSHDIALYAKWVNGLFTVKTYTDETMKDLYTYDGYNGVQENIVKYTLATAPADPKKDGHVFIGWFYQEGGVEKPFSFTMPITKNYNLYPKFSEPKAVTYTVHYYKAGTKERLASDSTKFVMIGTTVTEKAKMGKDLDLVDSGMQNKYYPTNTSTSEIIHQLNQEIIFYYTEATSVQYTVYYQDANRKNLIDPVTKTTEKSIVNEQYVPIPNYAPRQFSIMKELSTNEEENKIIFIYDPTLTTLTLEKQGWQEIDENQTFLFHVKGSPKDPNTKDVDLTVTIHGNGKTTVTDLPVGDYIITEESGWSWRYTPQSGGERTITVRAGGLTVQYQNDRTETQWLDGDNYRVNHFDSKNQ